MEAFSPDLVAGMGSASLIGFLKVAFMVLKFYAACEES